MEVLALAPSCTTSCRPHRSTHSLLGKSKIFPRPQLVKTCVCKASNGHQQGAPSTAVPVTADNIFAGIGIQADRAIPITAAVVAALSWYLWKQVKVSKERKTPPSSGSSQFDAALESANAQDGREYRMALARTRQAVAVHRAIGFLNSNNVARAMVELRRALHENSVCRSPLLNTQLEAAQLEMLYRLHLENTAQPADFATLLQLRTLLDIDFDVAEKIEQDLMQQGALYSI